MGCERDLTAGHPHNIHPHPSCSSDMFPPGNLILMKKLNTSKLLQSFTVSLTLPEKMEM